MAEPWLPLTGVKVVDFSMFVPGPFCSSVLADLGAEVVKVEAINGDPGRAYVPVQFRTENRNKRSISVNLKAPESAALIERLAKLSDIAIEGFRPGVAKRLGIDYETLKRHNGRLVYCAISGYGQTGPWRERPGHDVNYVAAAGGLAYPGQWLQPPTRSSLAIADMAGGSFAATAVLAALHERERTGRGVHLALSLFEAAFFWCAMRHSLAPDADPKAHIFPVNDVFETKDGRRLTLGILEDHFWNNFLKLAPELADEAYATDAKRRANGNELSARLAAVMRGRTADEWAAQLEANDVPYDLCLTPAQAADLPQLRERGGSVGLDGERFAPFPVFADGRRGAAIRSGVPRLGEHTREVLVELGFDDAEIAGMVRAGAVKAA